MSIMMSQILKFVDSTKTKKSKHPENKIAFQKKKIHCKITVIKKQFFNVLDRNGFRIQPNIYDGSFCEIVNG